MKSLHPSEPEADAKVAAARLRDTGADSPRSEAVHVAAAGVERATGLFAAFPALFAVQDVLIIAYIAAASWIVTRAEPSPAKASCARQLYVCFAIAVLGGHLRRSKAIPAKIRAHVYRFSLAGLLLWNYLMLRDVLPLVRPDSVDARLLALDLRIFGVEPALWLEQFATRPVVEWFSFFYFSYFIICISYLVGIVWIVKPGRITAEFAIGTLIVFSLGQLGYMAVPAFGPIRFLESSFDAPINGGFFWRCVWETVAAGSAMKDVFPSLHTAVPTWFTLFMFRWAREDRRFIWPARITAFFAMNIVISTLLLRWHYAVDVAAGLALAIFAATMAPIAGGWEERFRARRGLPGPWSFPK